MKRYVLAASLILIAGLNSLSARAENIKYRSEVVMKVGQSVVVKGVRADCSSAKAPKKLNRLPKTGLGKFSAGKEGTVYSKRCGKTVPAREVIFTAKRTGYDTFVIYKDAVKIKVK